MAKAKKTTVIDADSKSTITLSIRLLRENHTIEDALQDDHDLDEHDTSQGRLFIGQSPGIPPTWSGFLGQFSEDGLPKLENKRCSAVLFLDIVPDGSKRKTRTVALSFGGGHHALKANTFERNFGLRVTLNSVARSDLRNLDVATLDATSFQKRIQSSRRADLQGFGINVESDLLRLAGGVPGDSSFASTLAGKDALTITTKTSARDIVNKCKIAVNLFGGVEYKKDFDFIDYIVPVRDTDQIEKLDSLVFAEINSLIGGKSSDLHIALPEIINPEGGYEIGYFGLALKPGKKIAYSEVAIEDYIAELKAGHPKDIANMAELRASHEIRVVVDGEGDRRQRTRIYDCFVYETEDAGKTYVLFSGDWYCVDKNFYDTVERDFNNLVSSSPLISSTVAKDERELIYELDKKGYLLNLDQAKISPSGAAGANLEPCDFFSHSKQFIHLKDGHSSAPISHLWNQGVVSAESFVRDQDFRSDLRREVIQRQRKANKNGFEVLLPDGRSKPVPSDYKVVFGIMRTLYRRTKNLGLPFFSKVSLRPVAQRIALMGFVVEVHLIEKR